MGAEGRTRRRGRGLGGRPNRLGAREQLKVNSDSLSSCARASARPKICWQKLRETQIRTGCEKPQISHPLTQRRHTRTHRRAHLHTPHTRRRAHPPTYTHPPTARRCRRRRLCRRQPTPGSLWAIGGPVPPGRTPRSIPLSPAALPDNLPGHAGRQEKRD